MRYGEVVSEVFVSFAEDAPFIPVFAESSGVVAVDVTDRPEVVEGWRYIDGQILEPSVVPPKIVPHLVVDSVQIAVDGPNLYNSSDKSAEIPMDSDVLLGGWLEVMGNKIPVNARFRVPIVKRNREGGVIDESLGLAVFDENGMAASWKARQLGKWEVLENEINRDLPEERHMSFDGLTLYVY